MNEIEYQLLNDFQRDFPLTSRPFARLAEQLSVSEEQVLDTLDQLTRIGKISRVGPVFTPRRLGVSTLAAIAVPAVRLQEVADLVSSYQEVNHNYEREHHFNLWFVVIAADQMQLEGVLLEIEARAGLAVMSLPLLNDYHIDLGFSLALT